HRACQWFEAASVYRVEQRRGVVGLVTPGCLDLPRERQARLGADGGVDAISVEAAALARRDGAAVPPTRVRVAVGLPLRAILVEEPLAVGIGGHVARVDSGLRAHVGIVVAEGRGERVKTGRDALALRAELAGEAVAGPM